MDEERKGFESPMHRKDVKGDNKAEGNHEGPKANFGRKTHRHKKRSSHRK
jgi:hypothetical protein